jgi:hypothetical protein
VGGNSFLGTSDGILGLAPDDESSGPLLINYLHQQGKIKQRKFSIIIGVFPAFFKSYITFGGYQEEGTEEEQQKFYREGTN